MFDWNVVVSIREDCYRRVTQLLGAFGRVDHTDYYNVLSLKVENVQGFLEALGPALKQDPLLGHCLARVIPATRSFIFQNPEEFEARARETAVQFIPQLLGKTFYVRMHRRGFRNRLSSQHEEQMLDAYLLDRLIAAGAPGRIGFNDPDAVIAVETLGSWAGLSLWKQDELARYPFVRVS